MEAWDVLNQLRRNVRQLAQLSGVSETALHASKYDPSNPNFRPLSPDSLVKLAEGLEAEAKGERAAAKDLRKIARQLRRGSPTRRDAGGEDAE